MTFFQVLSEKRRQAQDRKAFEAALLKLFQDGAWTEDECPKVAKRFEALCLSPNALKAVRGKAYACAAGHILIKRYATSEDQVALDRIQQFLVIPDHEISGIKGQIYRLLLITQIHAGNLPSISVPDVVLTGDERAYWSEAAQILEERVVDKKYVGSSQGISVKLSKHVTYRVGAQRGHLISKKAVVAVSSGSFIVTNRRAIFVGGTKTFSIRLDKLLETHFTSTGLRCSEVSGKSHDLQFCNADNAEVVAAILSEAINRFKT